MKNLLKLAALIISTTVLSYAADTPDVPPLAGEDHQQRTVFYINSKVQDALTQDALSLSTLEERVKQHQELDSSPEDLATLKNDVKGFRFSDALAQYYKNANKTKSLIDVLREALTDKEIYFQKTLANSGVYTEDAMYPIEAFSSYLNTLKTQTAQFIDSADDLVKRKKAIQSVFAEKREDSRETSLTNLLAFLAISEIIGGGQDPFTKRTTRITPMGRSTSSNNEGCGNCPSCLLKKERQQASTRNPENTEKK